MLVYLQRCNLQLIDRPNNGYEPRGYIVYTHNGRIGKMTKVSIVQTNKSLYRAHATAHGNAKAARGILIRPVYLKVTDILIISIH
jgi:hypothetical protein